MVRGGSAARREASDRPPCAVKLLQETPTTMALSSRLTRVRARWRAARNSAGRLFDGHSRESGVKSVRRSGSGGQAAPLGAAARLLRRRAAT